MPNERMAYIAIEPCGCVTGAVVDDPDHAKETAKDVAEFIREGRSIERIPSKEVGDRFAIGWPERCPHRAQQPMLESEDE